MKLRTTLLEAFNASFPKGKEGLLMVFYAATAGSIVVFPFLRAGGMTTPATGPTTFFLTALSAAFLIRGYILSRKRTN